MTGVSKVKKEHVANKHSVIGRERERERVHACVHVESPCSNLSILKSEFVNLEMRYTIQQQIFTVKNLYKK